MFLGQGGPNEIRGQILRGFLLPRLDAPAGKDVEAGVSPGVEHYEAVKNEFEEQGVLGRWAEPEEIAAGILFLATDDASYMTGADLRLDGGWTTR